MTTTLDVIVPCYRYGHFLRECVESVLTQSGPSVRVLIIDDASPDNSAEIGSALARSDDRVIFVRHGTNKGHIATYNEGIDWISSKYMLLLSADDYLLPGALGRAAAVLEAHPEVGFVFGNAKALYDDGSTKAMQGPLVIDDAEQWRILSGLEFLMCSGATNIVPTPTAVVRTELLKRLGGYRPDMPHSADMELWWRLAAHSSVGFVREYQAIYRRHAHNMSRSYSAQRCLPDIQQRKATLEAFFADSGALVANPEKLKHRVYGLLGREAVALASAAFNDNEGDLVERLVAFAQEVCPTVKKSWAWRKLAFKRRIGARAWRAVQAATVRPGCSTAPSNPA